MSSEVIVPYSRKVRDTDNCGVPASIYLDAVLKWMDTLPILPLQEKLGPSLANDPRGVTPQSVLVLAPLFRHLFENGLANGVIQGLKLEQALSEIF